MLTLSSPELLFNKQKIFRINPHPQKASSQKQRRVLIVYEPIGQVLPQNLKDMADRLIVACKYKVQEAVYVSSSERGLTPDSIKSTYNPEAILVFGNVSLGASIPKNTLSQIAGIKALCAESLDLLDKSKTEKATLWAALKQMFNV